MLIEKLRDEFIKNKPKLSTLKSIYNNYKNSDLDYITLIMNPEKSKLVKIPFKFYLPSKVVRQETVINLRTNDKGHLIHSLDMENEELKSEHFLMHRIVAGSMVINAPSVGITYICSSLNKLTANIKNHWCSKKKSNKDRIRMIYIPNEESLNFKNTGFQYENCIHFNLNVISAPNSLVNIKITRVIEFIPKKEYIKYHYDSSDNSSTDEILTKMPINNTNRDYKTPILILINYLIEKGYEEPTFNDIKGNTKEIGNYDELETLSGPDITKNFSELNLKDNNETGNNINAKDMDLEPIEFVYDNDEPYEEIKTVDQKPNQETVKEKPKNILFDSEYQLYQIQKNQQTNFDYNNFEPLYKDLENSRIFEKVDKNVNINQVEIEDIIINNVNKNTGARDRIWVYDKYYIIKRLNTKMFHETNGTKLKLLDAAIKLISNSPDIQNILLNIKADYNETWLNFNNYLKDLEIIMKENRQEFEKYINIDPDFNTYLIPYINSLKEVYKRTHEKLKYDKKPIESEPSSTYKSIIIAAAVAASLIAPELIPEEISILNSWGLLKI